MNAFSAEWLVREIGQRLNRAPNDWNRMKARNEWFQNRVMPALDQALARSPSTSDLIVFSYSYAARRIFECAKAHECTTVLGQIDPGPVEEELVAREVGRQREFRPSFERAGDDYWQVWRTECELADRIVVNSEWSRSALSDEGVPAEKIRVVPLMYRAPDPEVVNKGYPSHFDNERPLRVLFLGSLIIRKGVHLALQAARLLADAPVEFWFVGNIGVTLPDDLRQNERVHWIGPVDRAATARHYRHCDVFLFPTLSDGFGLTQLEAMAHGLPVIASHRCGDVVRHQVDGLVLEDNSPGEIAEVLRGCLADPECLQQWSIAAGQRVRDFHPDVILPQFLQVTHVGPEAECDA